MPFIQIVTAEGVQEAVPLDRYEPLTIGSHYTNSIIIDEPGIGTLYARILWNKKLAGYELTSATGDLLTVSGQQITSVILSTGDELAVGSKKLVYQDPEPPETAPNPEISAINAATAESPEIPIIQATKNNGPSSNRPLPDPVVSAEENQGFKPVVLKTKQSATEQETLQEWFSKSRRPGERDPLRSPLMTTLTIVCLMLAIAAGAFYLLIGRQTAQADFQAARQDQEAGKYGPASERYEQFLAEFPSSKMAAEARREWGYCQIELAINGVGSDYARGLDWVNKFIEAHRGEADFAAQSSRLKQYCYRIATLSYELASRKHDPVWLTTGDEAERFFQRFKASDGSDEKDVAAIAEASRKARADLLEFTVKQESLAEMDRELQADNLAAVLATYRRAVDRYPHFQQQTEFTTRVQQALTAEQKRVRQIDKTSIVSQSRPAAVEPVSVCWLHELKRTRFDVQSDGINEWILSAGSLFAVDRLTGTLQWERNLGEPIPFEPIDWNGTEPHWLIPVESGFGIAAVNCETGQLHWQTMLPARCRFQPTVQADQILVVCGQQQLISLNLVNGQINWITQIPQPIAAPATSISAAELLLLGAADVAYLIDPDEGICQQVRYLGQAPGSIAAAVFPVGNNLLLFEMDQPTTGRIRVLQKGRTDWTYDLLQQERLPGIIGGQPVIWGSRLFVETYGPRIAAWQLSDAPGQPVLKRITVAPVPFSEETKLYYHPIEGDRLFLAGENLREMTLLTDTFEQQAHSLEFGTATQSLQAGGSHLVAAGSEHPALGKVVFQYDYALEETYWRMRLGGRPALLFPLPESGSGINIIDTSANLYQAKVPPTAEKVPWLSPSETLLRADAEPGTTRVILQPGLTLNPLQKLISYRNQVIRWEQNLAKRELLTLNAQPVIPPVTTDTYLFWANTDGLHANNWNNREQKIASAVAAVQAAGESIIRWHGLIPLDENRICGLTDTAIGIWHVEAKPTPHLQQLASQELTSVPLAFCRHQNSIYLSTQDQQLLKFTESELLPQATYELTGIPLRGPFSHPDGIFLQLDNRTCVQIPPGSAVPISSEPLPDLLALPPLPHPQGSRLFLEDGQIVLLKSNLLQWTPLQQLPSAPCTPPLPVAEGEFIGLKNGSLIFLPQPE